MIEVVVVGLGVVTSESEPLLLLRERDGARILPIGIGPLEAQAIALPLAGQQPPRPMTHDAFAAVIDRLGGRPRRVEITHLIDGAFQALLVLDQGEPARTIEVDLRPSDAVALAVRTETPIFVADTVMDAASVTAELEDADPASPREADEGSTLAPFRDFFNSLDEGALDPDRPGRAT